MKLMAQKQKVELLQHNVAQAKLSYAETLRTLETISEQIHEKRAALRPREPGVGAEKSSSPPSLHFDLDQCDAVSLAWVNLSTYFARFSKAYFIKRKKTTFDQFKVI